jgi:hypothetical protein
MSIGGLRDMGTHKSPPTRVLEVPVKWTRPARSPIDLQMDPEALFTIPTTLEDLGQPHLNSGRPAGLVPQASPLDHGSTPLVGLWIEGSSLESWKEIFLICNQTRQGSTDLEWKP